MTDGPYDFARERDDARDAAEREGRDMTRAEADHDDYDPADRGYGGVSYRVSSRSLSDMLAEQRAREAAWRAQQDGTR